MFFFQVLGSYTTRLQYALITYFFHKNISTAKNVYISRGYLYMKKNLTYLQNRFLCVGACAREIQCDAIIILSFPPHFILLQHDSAIEKTTYVTVYLKKK